MEADKPDFVLIQEPWINGGRICGLRTPNYKLYVADHTGKVRACIMAKTQLNTFMMHKYSNSDTTTISWETDGNRYRLSSIYMAYEDPVPSQLLKELVLDSEACGCKLIIGGDANAHHTIWGSSDINERGESLFNFILSTRLLIGNRGNEPTFVIRNRQEVLDITLISDSLLDRVANWRVLNEHSFSDHRFIECILEEELITSKTTKFRNHRKTNWPVYTQELAKCLPVDPPHNPISKETLDNLVETFTKHCNQALHKACPLVKQRGKSKPPWWSSDLKKQQKDCRTQFNKAKLLRDEREWDLYYEKLKIYKKEVRKTKRSSWRTFCGEIETTVEASRLRKILTKSTQSIGYLQRPDSSWTASSKESLDLLLNTHFPGNMEGDLTANTTSSDTESNSQILNTITEANITWAVETFQPYKAPGPDGIFPAQLQKSLIYIMKWLVTIFRGTLQLNYIPSRWREVTVVFIPKAGKSSHTNPKDFRPISLSSFLLKTLERLIDTFIRNSLTPSLLARSQHAYSKGKSTETALNSLVTEIEKSIEDKEYSLVAFLDIEGAFNNILPGAITNAMAELGIAGGLVKFIEQMLLGRFVISTLGPSTMRRSVKRGTPQGGVLSPLLWILTMNKLLKGLEERRIHVVAYADDVAILVRGKFPDTLCNIIQNVLEDVSRWAKSCGLGINASKTELILFTKKHSIPVLNLPTLGGITLTVSEKASYLGLVLDRKLSWKLTIEDRVKKAATALYTCKRIVGAKWGLTPKIVHWLYTAVVRPIMTYGVLVWWPTLKKKTMVKRMESIQRAASLCISGALRTTPTAALNVILHLLPIDVYSKQLAARSALRLRESSQLATNRRGHSKILSEFPFVPQTTDFRNSTELHINKSFTITFPTREDWDNGIIDSRNGISIYTDGSKLDEQVGGGFHSEELGASISFRLPDHCSVFQAEIIAIREGLLALKENVLTTREINIYSDSQAALKSLQSPKITSKTVKTCIDVLIELSTYFTINLLWVPGHRDIEGNCKADELARLGTTLPILADKRNIPIPLATCKWLIDKHILKSANTAWNQSSTCATTRLTWPEWNMGRTKRLLQLNRKDVRSLIGVLTGHCLIGRHASRLGAPYHDYCRSCQEVEEEESVEHLLCGCMALCRRRLNTLGQPFLDDIAEISKIKLTKIVSYIKATGWFNEDGE